MTASTRNIRVVLRDDNGERIDPRGLTWKHLAGAAVEALGAVAAAIDRLADVLADSGTDGEGREP